MIKEGVLCLPVIDEAEEPIFIPEGFKLREIETGRECYLRFTKASEGLWETLRMLFYVKDFKLTVYSIEYVVEKALEDYSHSFDTHEFTCFSELKRFFGTKKEFAKAS